MKKETPLQLAVDSLSDGHVKKIKEVLPVELFELAEDDDLRIEAPGEMVGEVYVIDGFLILSLSAKITVTLSCGFCNERFSLEVKHKKELFQVAVEELPNKVFDLGEHVREELLLEIPYYPLCGSDRCLHRKEVEQFLCRQSNKDVYCPFENI